MVNGILLIIIPHRTCNRQSKLVGQAALIFRRIGRPRFGGVSLLWETGRYLDDTGRSIAAKFRTLLDRFWPGVRTQHVVRNPPFAQRENNQPPINNEGVCHGIRST
jgi:hypothetical protein